MSASIRPSWALPTRKSAGPAAARIAPRGPARRSRKVRNWLPWKPSPGDKATKDLFENLDITWNRLPGGAAVGEIVKQALDSFVPARPEALLPELAKARPLIAAIVAATKDPLAERKLKELDETMALCSGLSLEAQSDKAAVSPGATLRVNFTAVQRLPNQVALTGISLSGMEGAPTVNLAPTILANNQPSRYNASFTIPQNQPYTQPYWLAQPKDGPLYSVPDPRDIGLPEDPPVLTAHFRVQIAGTELDLTRPVRVSLCRSRVWRTGSSLHRDPSGGGEPAGTRSGLRRCQAAQN